MPLEEKIVNEALSSLAAESREFLCDMIRIPSVRGNEGPVNRLVAERMRGLCTGAELMQIPESFKDDPLYSWPLPGLTYENTQNLRLSIAGAAPETSRSLIFNAHSDVVPPSKNQENAFQPTVRDGVVYGRGACDDKGQIAVLHLLLSTLQKLHLQPRGNVTIDIVVEEENGGNGTLFMTRHPVHADGAIVLEASERKIFAAVRGAVWFEVICRGKPGHSGRASDVVSALKEAVKAMGVLEEYHDKLLAASRGINPLFDAYANPMPVTFGMLHSGDWPATAPALASIKGVFGFLPNTNIKAVQQGMTDAIRNSPHEYLREHFEIQFNMLNNEGNELPVDHPLVQEMMSAARDTGAPMEVSAMTAACDAWRYALMGIPTIVMGAGSLKYAHSNEEQIAVEEIKETARTLLRFLERWCGFSTT
ncbi:MAG: putative Acetylornithine deacetylase [Bacteroidetes bacterium]|jgi:acetylornithine deacetylase|nr:putative Acetylornithine deacetylase [Bacteroidota bacterium]